MSLKDQFQQALRQVPAFADGSRLVEVQDGPRHLRCQLTALDSLACAFDKLALHGPALTALAPDELKQRAAALAARLTYLLEPISPIEIDSQGCVVQMRSSPPHKEEDRTSYYELLLARAGEISLCRYSRSPGQPRQLIAAHVTREVLARLIDDFSLSTK